MLLDLKIILVSPRYSLKYYLPFSQKHTHGKILTIILKLLVWILIICGFFIQLLYILQCLCLHLLKDYTEWYTPHAGNWYNYFLPLYLRQINYRFRENTLKSLPYCDFLADCSWWWYLGVKCRNLVN